MKRSWIFALMVVVVGLVVAIFVIDARHDSKLLFEGFVEERLASTKELATDLAARLASIRKDVLFFRYLVEKSRVAVATTAGFSGEVGRRFQGELEALLAVVPHYKEMHFVGPDGAIVLSARERAWEPGAAADRIQRALSAAALLAPTIPEGRVRISAPIHRADRRAEAPGFRIFSASVRLARGRRGAVLLLLEPDYLFGTLRAYRAPDRPRFALVNASSGRIAYASAPELKELVPYLSSPIRSPLAAALLGHEAGRIEVPTDLARRLGLGLFAVATYAPLPAMEDWRWTLAAFTSAEHLQERDRAVLLRTVAAMAAVLAGLGVLGALLLRQVRREAELREHLRTAEEIRHLHELSQKILDNIPSGLLALSADGRIMQANRRFQALAPSGKPGALLAEAFPAAPPAEAEGIARLVAGALRERQIQSHLAERTALFHREPGTYNLVAIPLDTPLHGVAALLIVEDLSELKRLEQELVRAEKLSTIGILAAGIAHEIGTPLGVIRARAEHLLGKASDGSGKALQAIVDQCDAISRIIRRVLEFTRTREVQSHPMELVPVCREVAELLRERYAQVGVSLTLSIPEGLPQIVAEADGLRQVLVNLLRNAADACKPGGRVEVRARAEAVEGAPFLRLEVRDNGCGIPSEQLHAVFDPFFTTKKGGEGTGLGLAIAQDIVKNHGGTLSVESEPGKGSVFTILWPAAASAAPAPADGAGVERET
jgi:signal transduction histidine kinase